MMQVHYDRVVPRTHSIPQAAPAEPPGIFDMEDDVRASAEMADVLYILVERGAVHGTTERDFAAIVRCASVLQGFTQNVLSRWEEACKAKAAA
jgi:hypothetical protein